MLDEPSALSCPVLYQETAIRRLDAPLALGSVIVSTPSAIDAVTASSSIADGSSAPYEKLPVIRVECRTMPVRSFSCGRR